MLPLALTLILAAVAYFVVTTLVDLYPLNNVRDASARRAVSPKSPSTRRSWRCPRSCSASAAALVAPRAGLRGRRLELLVAAGGLLLWWLPYLAGVTVPWATAGTGVTWARTARPHVRADADRAAPDRRPPRRTWNT